MWCVGWVSDEQDTEEDRVGEKAVARDVSGPSVLP